VSRYRPAPLAGVDWRAADAADPEAAADAAKGASAIYQCLNAPYNQWPERFPPLQRGVLAAAERTGALLVSLENLYGYGPADGRPMTEDLPLAATGIKGRVRAAMTAKLLAAAADAGRVRIAIGPELAHLVRNLRRITRLGAHEGVHGQVLRGFPVFCCRGGRCGPAVTGAVQPMLPAAGRPIRRRPGRTRRPSAACAAARPGPPRGQ
jgi:hypothetical protein